MRRSIAVALTLTVFAAAAPAFAAVRALPADPPATRTVELVEKWRLGDDDSDVLLGVVTWGALDSDGNTYLVDRQLSQIQVIGPDGTWLGTLGREGEGPGELRQPHALVVQADGSLGVVQGFPGRLIGIGTDGIPTSDITLGGSAEEGGFSFLRACAVAGDGFVASTGRMAFDMATAKARTNSTLGYYDHQGALIAAIVEHSKESDLSHSVYDEAAEFSELDTWAVGPGGLLYTVPARDAYAVNVRNLQGELVATYERPFTPRPRTRAEKDKMASDINIVVNGQKQEVQNKALDTDPPIRELSTAADGRLFVTNCYGYRAHLPLGTAGRYDVISPSGEFLEELTLLVPDFDGKQDVLFFLDGTSFLVIKNFDSANDVMENQDETEKEAATGVEPLSVIFLSLPGN